MEKMHIVFDVQKCVGCYNCMLACQDEHCGNSWLPYTNSQEKHGEAWVKTTRHERGKAPHTEVAFLTEMCRHCENAACEKAFPEAVIQRDDGIVLLNPERAKGNKELVKACPYGAIKWNAELETAQKCTLCAHLLDNGWAEPRCVQACPLRALSVVKCSDEEFASISAKQNLKPLERGNNKPRLLYHNLYRINTLFVCGAVAVKDASVIEHAVEGADCVLSLNGDEIASAKTDFFGEYKIDMLPPDSGEFDLCIFKTGYAPVSLKVKVGEHCPNVGVSYLE